MKTLIEDYERRLKSVEDMLNNFKSSGSINDIRKDERLKIKASGYRTFIAELKRELGVNKELKEPMNSEEPIFEWDLSDSPQGDAAPEELQEEVIWQVPVCRTGYGSRTIEVLATSEAQAIERALDEAGNYEFSENDADYSAPDGAFRAFNSDTL